MPMREGMVAPPPPVGIAARVGMPQVLGVVARGSG